MLVASPRALHALSHGIPLDALVLSAEDKVEREEAHRAEQDAKLVVFTEGGHGGSYRERARPKRDRPAKRGRDENDARDEGNARDADDGRDESEDREGHWPAAKLPGEPRDSYGCGDSFAAGLTYGLGAGLAVPDALALAARCGAVCLTGRGPYQRQLSAHDLAQSSSTAFTSGSPHT